jgi:hypothetical protein
MRTHPTLLVFLGAALCNTLQKILNPGEELAFSERILEPGLSMTVDVNVIGGSGLLFFVGKKGMHANTYVEVPTVARKIIEDIEKGEYILSLKNSGDHPVNFTVQSYVDKRHEETDEAEMLRKLLEKMRLDLTNLYNDNLKLKEYKTGSLVTAKKTKRILWALTFFPLFYIVLGALKLNLIKGFFSSNKSRI